MRLGALEGRGNRPGGRVLCGAHAGIVALEPRLGANLELEVTHSRGHFALRGQLIRFATYVAAAVDHEDVVDAGVDEFDANWGDDEL